MKLILGYTRYTPNWAISGRRGELPAVTQIMFDGEAQDLPVEFINPSTWTLLHLCANQPGCHHASPEQNNRVWFAILGEDTHLLHEAHEPAWMWPDFDTRMASFWPQRGPSPQHWPLEDDEELFCSRPHPFMSRLSAIEREHARMMAVAGEASDIGTYLYQRRVHFELAQSQFNPDWVRRWT